MVAVATRFAHCVADDLASSAAIHVLVLARELWFIGNLGGMQESHGFDSRLAVHPGGMSENSRGSKRSGDPRKARNEAVHPGGMPELLDDLRKTFPRFWHPSRMRSSFRTIPVVCATLRPPATEEQRSMWADFAEIRSWRE